MAESDKKKDEKAPVAPAAEGSAKKGPPIKLIGIVAGLMLAEAAGVYIFVGMTGGHAQTAEAKVEGAEEKAAQETTEIELVDDKFQNMQTGHVWVWDVAIALKAKQRNAKYINEQLEKRSAEISEGISQIIRRAQHSQLIEPELTTLNRQIAAYLDTIIKPDDSSGTSRIDRVLIPKCKGLQID
jgi:flagellar basal body-associated protein FliL